MNLFCLDGQSPQPREVGKFKLAHAGFVGRSNHIIDFDETICATLTILIRFDLDQ
jgi:hypothetical protein